MKTFASLTALLMLTSLTNLLAGDEPANKTKPAAKPGKKEMSDPLAKSRVRCWNDSKVELTLVITRVVGLDGKKDATRHSWVMKPGQHSQLQVKAIPLTAKEFDFAVKTTDGESTWSFAGNPFRKDGEMLLVFTDETLKKHTQQLAFARSEGKEWRTWYNAKDKPLFGGKRFWIKDRAGDTVRISDGEVEHTVLSNELSFADQCGIRPISTAKEYHARGTMYARSRKCNGDDASSLTNSQNMQLTRKALDDFTTALTLDPKHIPSHNSIAWELATSPLRQVRDAAKANFHADAALSGLEIGSAHYYYYLDTKAAAEARAGNYATAADLQRKAILGMRRTSALLDADMIWRLPLYMSNFAYKQPEAGGSTVQDRRGMIIGLLLVNPSGDIARDPTTFFFREATRIETEKGPGNVAFFENATLGGLFAEDRGERALHARSMMACGEYYFHNREWGKCTLNISRALSSADRGEVTFSDDQKGAAYLMRGVAELQSRAYDYSLADLKEARTLSPHREAEARKYERLARKGKASLQITADDWKQLGTIALGIAILKHVADNKGAGANLSPTPSNSSSQSSNNAEPRLRVCPGCGGSGKGFFGDQCYGCKGLRFQEW